MSNLFEEVLELPDPGAQRRYLALVGLDAMKERLEKEAAILLRPDLIETWSRTHHQGKVITAAAMLEDRPPLIIFGGDVGTGKTTLAETFGDAIARTHKMDVRVYRLSLQARGSGAVGEMTTMISGAFAEVRAAAVAGKGTGHVLIIDEADALAQSRELAQMHHEDRAGVNALIRGIDQLAVDRLGVLIVLCTNRVDALDPAVRRRASADFEFERPNEDQRAALLGQALAGAAVTEIEIREFARSTGTSSSRPYGYTYSDLVNRVVPGAVLSAYPARPLTGEDIAASIKAHPPTRPFSLD